MFKSGDYLRVVRGSVYLQEHNNYIVHDVDCRGHVQFLDEKGSLSPWYAPSRFVKDPVRLTERGALLVAVEALRSKGYTVEVKITEPPTPGKTYSL